jgi:hypothetical protein
MSKDMIALPFGPLPQLMLITRPFSHQQPLLTESHLNPYLRTLSPLKLLPPMGLALHTGTLGVIAGAFQKKTTYLPLPTLLPFSLLPSPLLVHPKSTML